MSPRVRYFSTSLALLAVGLGYALIQGRVGRLALPPPARAEAARPAPLPPAPPTAREMLERGTALSLTSDQTDRLEALDRQWQRESAPLEAASSEAEQEFSRFMREAKAGGKTNLQEIQRRSAEFRDRSAALRERRQIHAGTAARLLTETQRRVLAQAPSSQTPGGDR